MHLLVDLASPRESESATPDAAGQAARTVRKHSRYLAYRYDVAGLVRIWDTQTGTNLASNTGHTDTVTCLAFTSDGQT